MKFHKLLIGILLQTWIASVWAQPTQNGIPIPANTWVMVQTGGFPAQVEGFGKLVYGSGFDRSVMLENYHQSGSEPNQALVGYHFASNRWDVLSVGDNFHTETMPDGGHPSGMFAYNPNQNTFVYPCCFSGSQATERMNHFWWFDAAGLTGKDKHTSPMPYDLQAAGSFDAAHNVYVYFGNSGTWTYDPATNMWQQKAPAGTPPVSTNAFPSMAYSSANQKTYLFGGATGHSSDLYAYDVPGNAWTKLAPAGTIPPARGMAALAYDSTNNIFVLYGGYGVNDVPLNDTWIYNPVSNAWSQASPGQSPPAPAFASFGYLTYDSNNNVFVMVAPGNGGYANGSWGNYPAQVWLYRYAGTGPNAGTLASNPQPPSGSLNKNVDGWADAPALASSGSTLYAGWSEIGRPFDVSSATWPHVYASQLSGSSWVGLGGLYNSLDSENTANSQSHRPSMAIVDGTLWISWHKESGGTYAKFWNGSSWVGGAVGAGSTSALGSYPYFTANGPSRMAAVGTTPYIAFIENDRSFFPWNSLLYVKYWNGSGWSVNGSGPLNKNYSTAGDIADSFALGSDGASPVVAWAEYTQANPKPQIYVSKWNGSSWIALGSSLNVDAANGWAYNPSVAYLNGQVYVAWTERAGTSGNNQLYVKVWNGSTWSSVGSGSLNKNGNTGWSYRPMLATDNASLYVGWVEQAATGEKPQAYVAKYGSGNWTAIGNSLNADTAQGSAENVSLAILNGQPVAAWGEVALGSLRQVFVKQWNGSAWVSPAGSINPPASPKVVSFTAAPAATGPASTILSWATSNATSISINPGGFTSSTASGTYTVSPSITTTYTLTASNSTGQATSSVTVTASASDTQPPTTPTGLTATALSSSAVALSWNASTDNVAVSGYNVFRNGAKIGTATSGAYADSGVAPSSTYVYTVTAYDAAGNTSAASTGAPVTTSSDSLSQGIPSTYKTAHPRLPIPDNGYLVSLYNSGTEMTKYNLAADSWSSTNPDPHIGAFRRLLIAYLANKAGGNSTRATAYLNKVKALATNFNGTWGNLLLSVNDGVGTGSYIVTSQTANFLTGCSGGSCNGAWISVNSGFTYISRVVDSHTIEVNPNLPVISGTGISLRVLDGNSGLSGSGMELAIAYDWLYNDLDAATRTAFMNQLEQYVTTWEGNYAGVGASPYNDVFYIRYGPDGMPAALAIYPDYDDANPTGGSCPKKPCGTYHINYMMDKWFNVFVPVWHQVMGNSGGGWHENWDAYVNPPNGPGLTQWLVPSLLSWQGATGDPIFTKNPWLKNFAYLTMYMTRPDMTMQHIGEVSGGYLTNEYSIANADLYNIGVPYGSLNGLAEIYDDPALRGWARLVNQELASGPTGFEPSAWPFYTPDSNAKAVAPRSSLSTVHLFDGWGVIDARSGWGEDDTDVTFKYGDNFWSHSKGDTGSFTITHKGNLAINSGTYRAGSGSTHEWQYGRQTIAHNSLLIVDPNDYYPNQTFPMQWADGSVVSLPMANDGGQRRAGNPYNANNALFNNLGGAPKDIAAWNAASDYFHMGTLVAYEATPEYVYAAADITPAYNNPESSTQPNAVNRTKRATSVIRSMLFIRPGYVIIYDEVNATDATFKKKWLLHSVNQPLISGNRFEIDRTELVQPAPYADLWTQQWANVLKNDNASYQYKYGGKLIGWMVQPTGSINAVGGPGKEFWIEDPKNPGSGTNWNQCTPGQCQGDYSFLSPNKPDFMEVNPNYAPVEPGSWRIEESPSTAQTQDYFLNVMLATNYEDPNVPATVTGTSDSGTVGATWSDGKNTYAIKFARSGVGGHITVTGSSTIDKDLGTGVGSSLKPASCDINGDGVVNAADVQAAMDQALGAVPCTTANLHNTGTCTVVDVQRVIAASLGGACVTGQ